jgi:hypothetical protein
MRYQHWTDRQNREIAARNEPLGGCRENRRRAGERVTV